jgi:hypothetical protein
VRNLDRKVIKSSQLSRLFAFPNGGNHRLAGFLVQIIVNAKAVAWIVPDHHLRLYLSAVPVHIFGVFFGQSPSGGFGVKVGREAERRLRCRSVGQLLQGKVSKVCSSVKSAVMVIGYWFRLIKVNLFSGSWHWLASFTLSHQISS